MKTHSQASLLVSLADKVSNARTILRDLKKPAIGANIWDRFNRPKEKTLWYYKALSELFLERIEPGPARQLADELREIIDILEREG